MDKDAFGRSGCVLRNNARLVCIVVLISKLEF